MREMFYALMLCCVCATTAMLAFVHPGPRATAWHVAPSTTQGAVPAANTKAVKEPRL